MNNVIGGTEMGRYIDNQLPFIGVNKISLAFNDSSNTYICSSSYVVFGVSDQEKLYPGYLRVLLNRDEFNRYARFNSW